MTPGFTRYAPTGGPSRWLFVAGRRFVACVESAASDGIVDAVWWLAESDLATIESVVGAFPLVGPDSVRSFAVAELGEPNVAGEVVVTAVVRGAASIDVFSVGGSRRFSSGGVQPWVLAEFRMVTGLVLGGDDLPTGPVARLAVGSLPLGRGVVDGESLTWTLSPVERVERSASAPLAANRRGPVDETIIRGRSQSLAPFEHPTAAAMQPGPHPIVHELPRSATAMLVDVSAPTQPVVQPSPPPAFALKMPSGDTVSLDTLVLIGRRPAPFRLVSRGAPRLVTVPSPTQEVSGTHISVEQSGEAVVVTDLRSTNGTRVARPGGAASLLRPGESVVVLVGTTVEIGDGNIIEIIAAPASGPRGTDQPAREADRREEGRE